MPIPTFTFQNWQTKSFFPENLNLRFACTLLQDVSSSRHAGLINCIALLHYIYFTGAFINKKAPKKVQESYIMFIRDADLLQVLDLETMMAMVQSEQISVQQNYDDYIRMSVVKLVHITDMPTLAIMSTEWHSVYVVKESGFEMTRMFFNLSEFITYRLP